MANALGFYNPVFYANEALVQLEEAMGMASRVHLGFDEERRIFNRGDKINILRPGTFSAAAAPAVSQDITAEGVTITLDKWFEVKFKITDKELSYTDERIIADHIRPAARALANQVDVDLALLAQSGVPWYVDGDGGSDGATDVVPAGIAGAHRVLFENGVPLEGPQKLHLMINGIAQESLLGQARFVEQQGAGDEGVNVQRTGSLGNKYGFEIFANQNVVAHTEGTINDNNLLAMGAASKGATTVTLDAADGLVSGTLALGDSIVFAGHAQRYVVTATTAAVAGVFSNLPIFPALKAAVADDEVCTAHADNATLNLAFHHNSMAVAFGLLPSTKELGALGANVVSVQHPNSGVSLRSRIYYVGDSSEIHVALDILYGVAMLDPNLACRVHGPNGSISGQTLLVSPMAAGSAVATAPTVIGGA